MNLGARDILYLHFKILMVDGLGRLGRLGSTPGLGSSQGLKDYLLTFDTMVLSTAVPGLGRLGSDLTSD